MRKSVKFRPVVSESRLEERVVMTVAAVYGAPTTLPVVTQTGITNTLNQIHAALVSYASTVTNAVLYTESQIAAGKVTEANAISLLNDYISTKVSLLSFQTRGASANVPYGAGFNGYVNPTTGQLGALPSGSNSLYRLLTVYSPQPDEQVYGPVGAINFRVFNALNNGPNAPDFNAALAAVNSAAVHSTYQQVKSVVANYVIAGVKAHDFTY